MAEVTTNSSDGPQGSVVHLVGCGAGGSAGGGARGAEGDLQWPQRPAPCAHPESASRRDRDERLKV